jgi:hypothetical protein
VPPEQKPTLRKKLDTLFQVRPLAVCATGQQGLLTKQLNNPSLVHSVAVTDSLSFGKLFQAVGPVAQWSARYLHGGVTFICVFNLKMCLAQSENDIEVELQAN